MTDVTKRYLAQPILLSNNHTHIRLFKWYQLQMNFAKLQKNLPIYPILVQKCRHGDINNKFNTMDCVVSNTFLVVQNHLNKYDTPFLCKISYSQK